MASEFDFGKIEEKILKFWDDRKIFQKSIENRSNHKRFVFFEGPPTANGRPGIHHFLGRSLKDAFIRYKTMRGFLVERKAGWDTHGLPVEIEVEKELGLQNKKDIEAYGIDKFNHKAKQSVWKYKDEWERLTKRMGFWLDFKNPYITYDWKYMETLWWIIKQIDDKGFFVKSHKVLPWCPRCGTALSSHEVAQGYQDVTETSAYVKFKSKAGDASFLSWTTTPWTLPGNVALAINPKAVYVKVKTKDGEILILAKERLEVIGEHEVLEEFPGKKLVGSSYDPLFDIKSLRSDKSYKIYPADFVTTDDGTGIVHTAVMYGEDDYEMGKKIGLPAHHTVDERGLFTDEVKDFAGQYFKAAEKGIIEYLRSHDLLLKTEEFTHSYPFCWRCKSPLLYYARDSWFMAMSKLKKQLLKNNKKINWVPDHLKEGRFGEFLKEIKDWAFSRERYWGTPLPVWQCAECKEHRVIGSLEDLEKYRFHPKNTFYILRHGFSSKNHGGKDGFDLTASRLEHDAYDLIPEGINQVEGVAQKLKEEGGVDMIYSSPFLRTKHSAEIVGKALDTKVHVDHRLKELDHGSMCEGKPHPVCMPPGTPQTFDTKYGDGESWRDVKSRMFSVINELNQKHHGKKILLVSHGDPLWILEATLKNLNDDEMVDQRDPLYTGKGQIKEIDIKNYPYNESGDLDMHRPYVDDVLLKCEKCEGKMTRIKDVADVWFDSGSMPFAQWHYPFENKKVFDNNFPADFISEGIDQTRGWFYTLLAVSTLLGEGAPYKNVLSYSHVLDSKGKKMSKSQGNAVDPWEVIDQFGVDAARWYFYTVNNPADPKLFAATDVKTRLNSFIVTFLNSLRFFELYDDQKDKKTSNKPANKLDEWVLSRLSTINLELTSSLDKYDPTTAARSLEGFVSDLSNWWIRRSRPRFQNPKNNEALEKDLRFFRFLLVETSKLAAPFTPFLADHVYKKLVNKKESVHLEDWPKVKKGTISEDLEGAMSELRNLVTEGLAQRKSKSIKVRQPLANISIKRGEAFDPELEKLVMEELNVKEVAYDPEQKDRVMLDENLTRELIIEGYAREVIRQIQDMRKEAKYRLDDRVFAKWDSHSEDVVTAIELFGEEISQKALLAEFDRGSDEKMAFDVKKEFELAPQIKIWLGVRSKKVD
ncbi:MAG: class I tRNA ligase family protein [Candidatus Paceibacterota bacterium]